MQIKSINKKVRNTLVLGLSLLLGACGGSGVTHGWFGAANITYLAVDPNSIRTPTANTPTAFKVQLSAKAEAGYTITVYSGRYGIPLAQAKCNETCDGRLLQFHCTSSLSQSAPLTRELKCTLPDGRVPDMVKDGLMFYPATVPVGTMRDLFLEVGGLNSKLDLQEDHEFFPAVEIM
jgi:hypothetical protein